MDMHTNAQPRVKQVIGPLGYRLTIEDLPPSDTKRWVIRRKAEVVAAVRGGLLSLEEACTRYALTSDEFQSWQHCIDRYGLVGLRTTRIQFYRSFRSHDTSIDGRSAPRHGFACRGSMLAC